ncbi:MAG TPA: ferrous iron transport protein B [bacterium]|mgnify:FL=1|nr:ferrous iron transport protein B [Myxococcales bacterium]HPW44778.1 ferrous iron transport protein B [bacterium]
MKKRILKVAIAGNPNSGKTTIFNSLTGTRQKVANYPGVTVEKKEGKFNCSGYEFHAVDLPGTYSLTVSSEDERVARDFLLEENPDVIVDVVDASNFERNAYLTSQLLELGRPLVLVLNMSDRAASMGQKLDLAMISELLGCEVVETVGSRGCGISALKEAILRASFSSRIPNAVDYGQEIGDAVSTIASKIDAASEKSSSVRHKSRWFAVKLLEAERGIDEKLAGFTGSAAKGIYEEARRMADGIEGHHGAPMDILIAERRHGFAAGLYREVQISAPAYVKGGFSESIDDILTHRIFGIPLFFAIMYAVFYITFTLSEFPMRLIEGGIGWIAESIEILWPAESMLKSLVIDGMISGVGGVMVFLPNIALLFMCISILEDSGYMARVAFIMDKLMHKIGLHGKSFIPMVIGFGCSVPAIVATRTLENRRDRLATIFVIPLMSCGARLPIYTLIIPAFFPESWRPKVLWIIYFVGIVLAVAVIKLLRVSVLKGDSSPFVMELPPYRMPTLSGILIHMWERSKLYLKKAGTLILAVSIIMWFLTSYPRPVFNPAMEAGSRQDSEVILQAVALKSSIAGKIGAAIEPAIKPLGFDWRIGTALIGAFAAKEVFVSQMSIIFSLEGEGVSSMTEVLQRFYSPLVGVCVMLFCLIGFPCFATLVMTRKETGSTKWAIFQAVGLTALAYVVTFAVYQFGQAFGIGLI